MKSLSNAINGIVRAVREERNMKIHLVAASSVLLLSLFFKLSTVEFMILCLTIAFVVVCELFNTAVERIVDIIVSIDHPKAKAIKDISAGAVLVSALTSVIIGCFIFLPRIRMLIETGIYRCKNALVYVFSSVVIIAVLVFFIKALTQKDKSH